jgi:hypothetical protein
MGADFLCHRLAIHKEKTPDWEAGLNAAMRFVPDYNDPNWDHWGDGQESMFRIKRQLHADVHALKKYWEGLEHRRDTSDFHVADYYVVIASGQSGGDYPSDMYEVMERLWASEVALALGFE